MNMARSVFVAILALASCLDAGAPQANSSERPARARRRAVGPKVATVRSAPPVAMSFQTAGAVEASVATPLDFDRVEEVVALRIKAKDYQYVAKAILERLVAGDIGAVDRMIAAVVASEDAATAVEILRGMAAAIDLQRASSATNAPPEILVFLRQDEVEATIVSRWDIMSGLPDHSRLWVLKTLGSLKEVAGDKAEADRLYNRLLGLLFK